jgi:hypothetical protein
MTVRDEEERVRFAAEAKARGLEEWQLAALGGAPDSIMRDLISHAFPGVRRTGSASMIPDNKRSDEPPHAPVSAEIPIAPPSGVNYCDAIAESFARRDLAIAHQQRIELEWTESLIADRRNPHMAKTAYNPLKRYDNEVPPAHRAKGE